MEEMFVASLATIEGKKFALKAGCHAPARRLK